MTQLDLLDWVKSHGCDQTHAKPTFYRVVNKEGICAGIPQPKKGHKELMPMTIAIICTKLKVPVPDCALEALEDYKQIQNDHGNEI